MKFSFCSCLKRARSTYSISSTHIDDTNSNSKISTITIAPLPLLSDMPVVPIESVYEKIVDSSDDGEIGVMNVDRISTGSIEYGKQTKTTPIQLQKQIYDDDTELYATINKTRTPNNKIRIKTNATNTTDVTLRQVSLITSTTVSSSQPISSTNLHSTGFTITPEYLPSPSLPPPLPPLPPQVHTDTTANTIANDHDNRSTRRPYYEEVIVRESLQDRAQYLQIEEEQRQQEQQFNENYYSSVNSEQGATTSSDLYAEIGNGSGSGIIYQNPQYHYYSRPTNDTGVDDDTSERYVTVIELNNLEEDCTASRIYQDVDSLIT
ncbi:unnamed protein product [Rotaria sp. Silwood2]|nr:unnamed protein product [Rotaria sp. Silwood2]CAF3154923.1 unnamed protein product [Rotaria sp. Silwood2]CAF3872300.1 unnamed protein product [Rotaria sp. Silwood2]CAF4229503.1 unnamed protein product [Rotaria sp. Silwood2]